MEKRNTVTCVLNSYSTDFRWFSYDNMKYLRFKFDLGPIPKYSFFEKILIKLMEIVIPKANPDFEESYHYVETWYIEYDETCENDGVCREIGRDVLGRIIFKTPDDRNYGFWADYNGGLNDYIEEMHAEFISQEEFESTWNEKLVRVDKKTLNTAF